MQELSVKLLRLQNMGFDWLSVLLPWLNFFREGGIVQFFAFMSVTFFFFFFKKKERSGRKEKRSLALQVKSQTELWHLKRTLFSAASFSKGMLMLAGRALSFHKYYPFHPSNLIRGILMLFLSLLHAALKLRRN